MTGRQVLIGTGLAGAGLLVAQYFYKQQRLLMQMGYRIRKVRLLKRTAQEVVVSFEFMLENKSKIGFRLTGIDLNVYTPSGEYLARFVDPELNTLVPANTTSEPIPMVIRFDPRKLGRSVLQIVSDLVSGEGFALRFVGDVSVTTGLVGFRKLGVDYTYYPLDSEE